MAKSQAGHRLTGTAGEHDAEDRPSPGSGMSPSEGRFFEIRVTGHLNLQWSDWLEGLTLTPLDNGEMILSGMIVDQAALMGVLNKLNGLNLTLLSVSDVSQVK